MWFKRLEEFNRIRMFLSLIYVLRSPDAIGLTLTWIVMSVLYNAVDYVMLGQQVSQC